VGDALWVMPFPAVGNQDVSKSSAQGVCKLGYTNCRRRRRDTEEGNGISHSQKLSAEEPEIRLKSSDLQITLLYASSFPFACLLGFIGTSVE